MHGFFSVPPPYSHILLSDPLALAGEVDRYDVVFCGSWVAPKILIALGFCIIADVNSLASRSAQIT